LPAAVVATKGLARKIILKIKKAMSNLVAANLKSATLNGIIMFTLTGYQPLHSYFSYILAVTYVLIQGVIIKSLKMFTAGKARKTERKSNNSIINSKEDSRSDNNSDRRGRACTNRTQFDSSDDSSKRSRDIRFTDFRRLSQQLTHKLIFNSAILSGATTTTHSMYSNLKRNRGRWDSQVPNHFPSAFTRFCCRTQHSLAHPRSLFKRLIIHCTLVSKGASTL
jgi:hypothetical protein